MHTQQIAKHVKGNEHKNSLILIYDWPYKFEYVGNVVEDVTTKFTARHLFGVNKEFC